MAESATKRITTSDNKRKGIQGLAKYKSEREPKASKSRKTNTSETWFAARAVFTCSETKSEMPEKQRQARIPARTDFHQKENTKIPETSA